MDINNLSQDSNMVALKNHVEQQSQEREILLMKKSDFQKVKNRSDLDTFLKEYNESPKYVSNNIFSNEKSFMYEYLFENNKIDKNIVESATRYSLIKNDTNLLNKCLEQEVFKVILEDKHVNNKYNYLKSSKNECTEILLDKLDFKSHELTAKLNEDLDFGKYNNVNKLIEKGADKDKVFLDLSSGKNGKAIGYLVDNQNYSKEILEQGLMNSIKKGELNNTEEDINIFDKDDGINFSLKQENNNVFSNLYDRFEFSKETYEKVIKEAIKETKYELVAEVLKDQKIVLQEIDLTSMKIINPEHYEMINKINMKNKLSDKLEPTKKNKDIDLTRKI